MESVGANRGLSLRKLDELTKNGELDGKVADQLKTADLNHDGFIDGAAELIRALKALGADPSMLDGLAPRDRGRALQRDLRSRVCDRVRPRRALSPAPDGAAPPVAAQSGGAASLQGHASSAGRFQGGGPVQVTRDASGKPAAVQFKADMDVDTDGGTSRLARSDRFYQSQTSMKWSNGRSLDSDRIPFVVLPPAVAKATGAKLGDLVEVEQNGKKMFAIYGDAGPSYKIGEASLAVARAFDPKAGPNRAAPGSFTYTVLPGSGAHAGIRNGGAEKSAAEIQAAGARAFAEARARGVVR